MRQARICCDQVFRSHEPKLPTDPHLASTSSRNLAISKVTAMAGPRMDRLLQYSMASQLLFSSSGCLVMECAPFTFCIQHTAPSYLNTRCLSYLHFSPRRVLFRTHVQRWPVLSFTMLPLNVSFCKFLVFVLLDSCYLLIVAISSNDAV